MRRRNGAHDHGVGADAAIVADFDLADDLRAGADDDAIADARRAAVHPEIAQRNAVINRALLAERRGGVNDNAAEMMNSQSLADPRLDRNRNSGRDLDKSLEDESHRLRGNVALVKPAKDAIDRKSVV